jgi:hypothetical protein
MSEEGKKKFKELKEKLESMKNFDPTNYVENLEKNFNEIYSELSEINGLRLIEERINTFLQNFVDNRMKMHGYRKVVDTKIKSRDNRFKFVMGPLLK